MASVASIAVIVSDLPKAREWYTRKLGLDLIVDEGHWVGVGRKGAGALLHLCGPTKGWKPDLEPGNSGILLQIQGDFEKGCAALALRGVEFSQPATKSEWGWTAQIRDPDGNEHSLMPV
ncbi:MAG: VOC family protein [Thermoplasmata archaeon]